MLPIHLDIGSNEIYFYEGIYFLLAIVIGVFWAYKRVKKYGGDVEKFDSLIVWALVAAMLGARLSHYLFWNFDLFMRDPSVILSLSGAGNSITGGLLGGMLGGWIYTKRNNMNYWKYFSMMSPAILLAQAVGRIGCFLNGDAYGTATNLPWGIQFPRYGTSIPSFEKDMAVSSPAWRYSFDQGLVDQASTMSAALHPTQLYEMFGDLILMVIVLWVFKLIWDKNKTSPLIFFIHTGGYALLRFGLEFIRADREGVVFANMSSLQLVLLGYGLFTIYYAARYFQKNKN